MFLFDFGFPITTTSMVPSSIRLNKTSITWCYWNVPASSISAVIRILKFSILLAHLQMGIRVVWYICHEAAWIEKIHKVIEYVTWALSGGSRWDLLLWELVIQDLHQRFGHSCYRLSWHSEFRVGSSIVLAKSACSMTNITLLSSFVGFHWHFLLLQHVGVSAVWGKRRRGRYYMKAFAVASSVTSFVAQLRGAQKPLPQKGKPCPRAPMPCSKLNLQVSLESSSRLKPSSRHCQRTTRLRSVPLSSPWFLAVQLL